MKRRGCASCAIYRKYFPGRSWCMRSADHSSRQHRDGPSIRIGATTRSGPINSLARSLPLAVRRKDGGGEPEFKNRGHRSVFGAPNPRTGLYEGPRPLLCVRAAHAAPRLGYVHPTELWAIMHLTELRYPDIKLADRPAQKLGSENSHSPATGLSVEQLNRIKEFVFGHLSGDLRCPNWEKVAKLFD